MLHWVALYHMQTDSSDWTQCMTKRRKGAMKLGEEREVSKMIKE